MPAETSEIVFRPAEPGDVQFVFDTWMRSWRTCRGAGTIRNDMYFDVQRATIEGLIGRGAKLEVACYASDPSVILGWCCSELTPDEHAVVHYIYVKDAYLPFGIGPKLADRAAVSAGRGPGFYTHNYRQVTDACRGWRHAPEIARRR